MSNRRIINSALFTDDEFLVMDDLQRLIWIGLIVKCADAQGRLPDNPLLIKAEILPVDERPVERIASALAALVDAGLLWRYEARGKKLLQIVNWWRYQNPAWAAVSKYAAPDGWTDRVRYVSTGRRAVKAGWESTGGFGCQPEIAPEITSECKPESEVETEKSAMAKVAGMFEQEIGELTEKTAELLRAAIKEYPPEWITEAIGEAVEYNKRSWKYVRAILDRWQTEGKADKNGRKYSSAADLDKYRRLYQDYKA